MFLRQDFYTFRKYKIVSTANSCPLCPSKLTFPHPNQVLSALKECLKTSTNFGRQTFLCHCAACSSTWTFVGLFVLIFIKNLQSGHNCEPQATVSSILRLRRLRIELTSTYSYVKTYQGFFILFTKYKKQSRVLVIKIDKTGRLCCMLGLSTPHFGHTEYEHM